MQLFFRGPTLEEHVTIPEKARLNDPCRSNRHAECPCQILHEHLPGQKVCMHIRTSLYACQMKGCMKLEHRDRLIVHACELLLFKPCKRAFTMSEPPRALQSKAWSCESFLRGASFLREQSQKKNVTPLDAIKVAWYMISCHALMKLQ